MSQPQPGLDITVHCGGPVTTTDTTTAVSLGVSSQFAETRVRKLIVQPHGGAIAVGGSNCSLTSGAENGIYLATLDSYTFHNVKPADVYFHCASTAVEVSWVIEM